MSLPEISRRCLSCGAAVRAGGRFCPQCGNSVGGANASQSDSAGARAVESRAEESVSPETRDAEAPRDWVKPTKEFSAFVQALEGGARHEDTSARAGSEGETPSSLASGARGGVASSPTPSTGADTNADTNTSADTDTNTGDAADDRRGRVARVRETTRARVEHTRARVEKMRDDALVAFEETPDDSGLRFVVAAVAVFLLFLFLLVLSTTVLR